jgi:hypothetical protein
MSFDNDIKVKDVLLDVKEDERIFDNAFLKVAKSDEARLTTSVSLVDHIHLIYLYRNICINIDALCAMTEF